MVNQRFEPAKPTEVLIAALNEEEGIGATISELSNNVSFHRILVVDGRSNDRTIEIAMSCGAETISQDGIGKGDAISKALKCLGMDTEYVVLTDADFTYPVDALPEMIRILEEAPQVGMVCGNRFNERPEKKASGGWFYYGNKLLAFAHNFFNGVDLKDPLTGLRVIRAGILRNFNLKSDGFDVEVELNSRVTKEGFHIQEIPIKYRERLGQKKLRVRDGATIFKRILLEAI
jgi:glycosyltransferase involved in cell wall biosynthesis